MFKFFKINGYGLKINLWDFDIASSSHPLT